MKEVDFIFFRMIIDNPVICTDVMVTAVLPSNFKFRNLPDEEMSLNGSRVTRKVGAITSDSDFTFEFGVIDKSLVENSKKVPIQFQIEFTRKNKSKYLRVMTTTLPITLERPLAENNCNVAVLSLHAIQQSAKLAQSGESSISRGNLLSATKLLQRSAKTDVQMEEYSNFISLSEDLDTALLNLINKKGLMDDVTVKTLQRMKTMALVSLLAGSKKKKAVSKRKKHTQSAMKPV